MATIDEIRKTRLKKLEAVKKALIDPYPEKSKRTHSVFQALADFDNLSRAEKEIVLAGRIKSLRGHGGSLFLDIEDGTGKLQAFLKKDRVGDKRYRFFSDSFDIGDFAELRGILFETKKGEKTIEISDFKMLAKSLLPLPEKWHGLQDVEERFRKRYLDLIFNSEAKNKFEMRSLIIREIRNFMEKQGFLEVETPILQAIYGGAAAKPFKTFLNALDLPLFLRIAPELYLKRLLVGGFEKVYEIGRVFRNEGMDRFHNPDYTIFEFYWAYADYKMAMKLTEDMFDYVLKNAFGKLQVNYEGKKIDFKTPWPRIEFNSLFKKYTKIDFEGINEKALREKAKEMGIKLEKGEGKPEMADKIFKKYCQPKIWNPAFVIHYPSSLKPLAKALQDNPKRSANFHLIVAGWELINAYSEQNNPLEQFKRFKEQEESFKEGLEEAQRMDKDFIEALEYGMPPAAGFGMGIDRLVALLTDSHSLREVILFPTMKPKK